MRVVLFILVFQLVTLLLYYAGPINYSTGNQSVVVVLLVGMYLISLFIGYLIGRKYYFKGGSGPKNASKFIVVGSWVSILFLIAELPSKILAFVVGVDIGSIYSAHQEAKEGSVGLLAYVRMPFGYYIFGLLPVLILFWRYLSVRVRSLGVVAVILDVLGDVLIGVNKKLFDTLIIAFVFYIYRHQLKVRSLFKIKTLGLIMVFIGFSIAVGYFFQQGQVTRHGSFIKSGVSHQISAYSDYSEKDGVVLSLYSALTGYLTQGYRAFDLALEQPFDFTWGVGNSTFLSRQVDRLLDVNISDSTYPAKIESLGWDRYNYWSSFYVWWASDLTFYGVIVLMLIIGFGLGSIENTTYKSADISSGILYSYLAILLFYLSANNQIFQSGQGFFGFVLLLIPFLWKRRLVRYVK